MDVGGKLGGAVPRYGELEFVLGDAGAVVDHADEAEPAARRRNLDARRPGIERVFHQFLDDARGPFDDLAGGDLVDHRF